MTFSDFIEGNLEAIIGEWRAFARARSPESAAMSSLALDDHARGMLLAIVSDMRTSQTEDERTIKSKGNAPNDTSGPETAAFTHGATRHLSGFDLNQVVSEFRALRASVLALWRESGAVRVGENDVEEIASFNEGLDQALAESIVSYSRRVNQSRDMFLAVLGHDVRGPLSGISVAADILASPTLAETVRLQTAGRIRRAVRVVDRLTTDLLEYARSRLGDGMPVEQSKCDLLEIFEEAVDSLRAARPGQAIVTDFSGELSARCDAARMQQALGNLLNNAVQHGDLSRPISVTARREADAIVLAVSNHGQPIPPESYYRIFEPMFRLPPRGDDAIEQRSRVGLGLFIVKQIVEGHGGTIEVQSSVERTVFTIRLPDAH